MIHKYTHTDGNVIVTDLRGVETIYAGNRFVVYCLFKEQNISVWVVDGKEKLNCAIAVGHSVLNRTSQTDVGSLLLKYEGGGHHQVGTCQVPHDEGDDVLKAILEKINADG
jgi:nanoRNase/pAp phosphatase (c-di-AMP/oligoRNAs hydrolase)